MVACIVRDLPVNGARLKFVSAPLVPETFILNIPVDGMRRFLHGEPRAIAPRQATGDHVRQRPRVTAGSVTA